MDRNRECSQLKSVKTACMANLKKSKVGAAIAPRIAMAHAPHGRKIEYGRVLKISTANQFGKIANGG